MTYSAEQAEEIAAARSEWLSRSGDLALSLLSYDSRSSRSSETLTHGLCRRLRLIDHLVRRVVEVLPPDEPNPTTTALLDVTAFLHAFMINIAGAIDNLARAWCLEAGLTEPNGKPLRDSYVGLGPGNKTVRETLSRDFRSYLVATDTWFEYLESYRHALAHRIPLYIPPRQLGPTAQARYKELEDELATLRIRRDFKRWDEILNEQAKLGVFDPLMMHSFGEGARPVRFHGQMVCDLATLVELGERMVKQLEFGRERQG
jgi:hypothetical protein